MLAAADLVHFPLVEDFRLVDVVASGSVLPIPETTESTYYDDNETMERANDEDIRQYYYELGCAKFTAVRGGRHINVQLGQKSLGKISKVQTHLSGTVVIRNNKL